MKTRARRQPLLTPVALEVEPPLSPQRAFVVQFREGGDGEAACFSGRVEHMVSGRAARFHSPEELLTFFAQVLSATRAKPP